jgi:hypothetical protein
VWWLVVELISGAEDLPALLVRMRKHQTVRSLIGYFATSVDAELNDKVPYHARARTHARTRMHAHARAQAGAIVHAHTRACKHARTRTQLHDTAGPRARRHAPLPTAQRHAHVMARWQVVEAVGRIAALPEGRAVLVSQGCVEMLSHLMVHACAGSMTVTIGKICGTVAMLCIEQQAKAALVNTGLVKLMMSMVSQTVAASQGEVPLHVHAVLGTLANVVDEQSAHELLEADSIRAFCSLLGRARVDVGLAAPTSKLLAACLRCSSAHADFGATIEPMLPELANTLAAILAAGPDHVVVGALCGLLRALAQAAGAAQRAPGCSAWQVVCSAELVAGLSLCAELHVESKDLACHVLPVLCLMVEHAPTEALSVRRTLAILGPLLRFNSSCASEGPVAVRRRSFRARFGPAV